MRKEIQKDKVSEEVASDRDSEGEFTDLVGIEPPRIACKPWEWTVFGNQPYEQNYPVFQKRPFYTDVGWNFLPPEVYAAQEAQKQQDIAGQAMAAL